MRIRPAGLLSVLFGFSGRADFYAILGEKRIRLFAHFHFGLSQSLRLLDRKAPYAGNA